MAIRRWEPFAEVRALSRAMDRLIEEAFRPFRFLGVEETIPVDMYHTPDAIIVKAELPGVKPEDIEISISGNSLTIKGEIKEEKDIRREDYLYQERRYGTFSRTLSLPPDLETEKAEATFENGILTLTIPKAEEIKRKVIKIKTK